MRIVNETGQLLNFNRSDGSPDFLAAGKSVDGEDDLSPGKNGNAHAISGPDDTVVLCDDHGKPWPENPS